jgi:hypothetical protein
MARWINNKASRLGLNWQSADQPRLVNPGEVFDAELEEIPQSYRDLEWIVPAEGQDLIPSAEDQVPATPPSDTPSHVPDAPAKPERKRRWGHDE